MFRRILLLAVALAVPVLTALGTQQLATTTEPPVLPAAPVQPQLLSDPSDPPGSVHDPAGEPGLEGQQDDAPESGSTRR